MNGIQANRSLLFCFARYEREKADKRMAKISCAFLDDSAVLYIPSYK
jgi:hypothetical protein